MIWAALICLIPTLLELWLDRNGEARKNKPKQLILLALISGGIAWISNYLFDIEFFRSLALTFGFHTLVFDFAVTFILHKRGVIESPEARKWWSYTGSTSRIDLIVKKIPWVLRLVVKLVIFFASIYIFIAQWP